MSKTSDTSSDITSATNDVVKVEISNQEMFNQIDKPTDAVINNKPQDVSIIQDDEVALDETDLEVLKKQGIDDEQLVEILEVVNAELSDNANIKEKPQPAETKGETADEMQTTDDKATVPAHQTQTVGRDDDTMPISLDVQPHHALAGYVLLPKKLQCVSGWCAYTPKYYACMLAKHIQQQEHHKKTELVKSLLAKKHSTQKIDHKQVRINIEANALPTPMFYMMNGLAAVIAGYGLLANSPAVVIGAMLVAMMLGPITGMALAVIDARLALVKTSFWTLITGTLLIVMIGMVLGLMHGDHIMTDEILARTAPTTMDLMVALAGGVAGALAMISPNLSVAVVGVAVATALVPPLTASGILLAGGYWQLAGKALLLAITNMIAIQFTNALVLWFAGFRRRGETETLHGVAFLKRNWVALLSLVVIGAYLSINLTRTTNQQIFERQSIEIINDELSHQSNYLASSTFRQEKDVYVVQAVVQGINTPSVEQVARIERRLQELSDKRFRRRSPISLQVRFLPEVVIESTETDTAKQNAHRE